MKMITMVEEVCRSFEDAQRMPPRVILLPKKMFDRYDAERRTLDSVLPEDGGCVIPERGGQWTDIRIVEHAGIDAIECY